MSDKPINGEAITSAMLVAFMNAFDKTFDRLAAAHENKPGEWLDELERELVRDIKGSHSQGSSIEEEELATRASFTFLQGIFAQKRANLLSST